MGKPRHGPHCCSEAEPASEIRSASYAQGLFFLDNASIRFYSVLKPCRVPDVYELGPSVGYGYRSCEVVRTDTRGRWLMVRWPCAKVTATWKFTLKPSLPVPPPRPLPASAGEGLLTQNRGLGPHRFPSCPRHFLACDPTSH